MLVAFVPVLHRGYLELFAKYGDELGILGPDVLCQFTAIVRDLRVVDPYRMKSAVEGLGLVKHVRVLTSDDLLELRHRDLVMPDDDISHQLVERFGLHATFVSTFLRWDKMPSTVTKTPAHDRTVTVDALDRELMTQALDEAKHSADWWRQVGAIIVRDSVVLAQGHNRHLPTDFHLAQNGDPRSNFDAGERIDVSTAIHSEAGLIAHCANNGIALRGSSIYVTTFPCPNCARLIALSGINRAYYAEGYSLLDAEDIFKAYGVAAIFVDLANANP